MSSSNQAAEIAHSSARASSSKKRVWVGRVLSGLVVLFLIPDGIVKFIKLLRSSRHSRMWDGPEPGERPRNPSARLHCTVCDSAYLNPRCNLADRLSWRSRRDASARGRSAIQPHSIPDLFGRAALARVVLRDDRVRVLIPLRSKHHSMDERCGRTSCRRSNDDAELEFPARSGSRAQVPGAGQGTGDHSSAHAGARHRRQRGNFQLGARRAAAAARQSRRAQPDLHPPERPWHWRRKCQFFGSRNSGYARRS